MLGLWCDLYDLSVSEVECLCQLWPASCHYLIAVVRWLRTLLYTVRIVAVVVIISCLTFLAYVVNNCSHWARSWWPERVNGLPASQPYFVHKVKTSRNLDSPKVILYLALEFVFSFIWIWMNHKLTSYKLITFIGIDTVVCSSCSWFLLHAKHKSFLL